ncbi:hypothetical protein, partial [Vibrio cyclitrophicus]|uniref:hypothetical protein n=1 Tax=Vibrio cyclitrophicus TaxID=47951 RepID=UPI001C105790
MTTTENRNDIMFWWLHFISTNHQQAQQRTSISLVPSTGLNLNTLGALASTSNVSNQVRAPLHEVATF